jgi:hypothetical protein
MAGDPMNAATNRLSGPVVEVLRGVDLLEDALAHDRHPVAHGHGLHLVVGDVDGGDAELVLELGDLGAHLHPQLGVEVRQRLVHQERLTDGGRWLAPWPPAGAGRRRAGPACAEHLVELEHPGRLLHPAVDLLLGRVLQLEGEADVVGHVMCGYSA